MARVLIVEDHEDIGRMLCRVVREMGHQCQCVRTKAEALGLLARASHALALVDIILPDGRGYEVVERAEQLGIRVITMSGHPDEIRTVADGNALHLSKPFGIDEFERLLRDNVPTS